MRQENGGRRLFQKTDLWILLGLLIACTVVMLFLYLRPSGSTTAQIAYEGNLVKEIDLKSSSDGIFTLEENPKVSFEIRGHQIRFVDTDCPDKLCENVGFISKTNQVAICLPNRVSLKIVSSDMPDIDAVVN